MDQIRQIERERQALQRNVSTLLWLATFCEWLAFCPRPLRHIVLWYFRPREALLRLAILRRIERFGFWSELPEMTYSPDRDSREDALRLAIRFETLAGMIDELLEIADFEKGYEVDPLIGFSEDEARFYDAVRHAPLNRRSRVVHDMLHAFERFARWQLRIPDS